MDRGYCGIGVVNMKKEVNYGTLFRSAFCFGADFIFLIGHRFKKQASDTVRTERHIPLYEYTDSEDFLAHRPYDCQLVGLEICDRAMPIRVLSHPERAIYILGQEDGSLPKQILDACQMVAQIPTSHCLNVSVAGSIILFDRFNKMK